ncbi:unnamed protein product [Paramecium primaurelia]|uniref:Uncharacterized protein n=1 Tax=Paramecium primaurelia TaxID=5886 RepID=A0A8S1PQT5_PARPR|nr:unnamed protein product [Paramecium primaurelia]
MEQDSNTILSSSKERRIKVILIGDQSVGKSTLLEQLLNVESKVNDKEIQTVDFFISRVILPDNSEQKIFIWVTTGEIKNINLIRAFLIKSHIYVIAFSLNNPVSFENAVNTWFAQCYKNARETNNYYYFIGTMSDKEHLCGSYQEIIQRIADKCQELKIEKNAQQVPFPTDKAYIRQSAKWNDDNIIEFAKNKLPNNVFYSETSAVIKTGIERSSSIFIRLLQTAVKQEYEKDGIEPIIVSTRTDSRFSMAQMQVPNPVVLPTSSARQSTQSTSLQVSMIKEPVPFLSFEQKESNLSSMDEVKKEQKLCCMIQ